MFRWSSPLFSRILSTTAPEPMPRSCSTLLDTTPLTRSSRGYCHRRCCSGPAARGRPIPAAALTCPFRSERDTWSERYPTSSVAQRSEKSPFGEEDQDVVNNFTQVHATDHLLITWFPGIWRMFVTDCSDVIWTLIVPKGTPLHVDTHSPLSSF